MLGDSTWQWLDPGVMAVIGAGSLLGGVTRLTLAVTVIVVGLIYKHYKHKCSHPT